MSNELLPCPNPECDAPEAFNEERHIYHFVWCPGCEMRGPEALDRPEAARLWNLICGGRGLTEEEAADVRFGGTLLLDDQCEEVKALGRKLRALAAKHQGGSHAE